MPTQRVLRLNWVEGRPTLSGGVKSNRLLAEAMARRGHSVRICHMPAGRTWPSVTNPRQFLIRLGEARRARAARGYRHHLESAAVPLVRYSSRSLSVDETPDADATFASWWDVWRQVAHWPDSKGLKIHLVRGHEVYANAPNAEIEAAYRLPGHKVAISGWLQRILTDRYGHTDVVRVPNGVDLTQFDSPPRDRQPTPVVGTLVSPSDIKNSKMALDAVRALETRFPGIRCVGFGSRPPPDDWTLPTGFEFHLKPEQSLIPRLYQSCDCWLVSSRTEGFGMPGIEAAAGHCPIISTRCGGPEDYVQEGVNGHLVDIDDTDAMTDRLADVLSMDNTAWRAFSAASYDIARDFDWDRSAEKLEAAVCRWLDEARATPPNPAS